MSGDGKGKPAAREDRLAARLRENLKKRKEQARAREDNAGSRPGSGKDEDLRQP